ncbi:UNVERIFIED_ORG: 2-keto-4-pentenoate hydratase [Paraburkholderia sediminicola]|nr:2-keto-4-pentenoate hydratase [Paraburkholderia sediminicola]
MNRERLRTAAQILKNGSDSRKTITELPSDVRPLNKAAAYDIQREYGQISNLTIAGWKIAATGLAGQKHIGVVRPIAGLVFEDQILAQGSTVSLSGSVMKIAEAEFAFRMRRSLVRRNDPHESAEVLDAIGDLLLAFEIPNSRYEEFSSAGELKLIADRACAAWLVLKKSDDPNWRDYDFARHAGRTVSQRTTLRQGLRRRRFGQPPIGHDVARQRVERVRYRARSRADRHYGRLCPTYGGRSEGLGHRGFWIPWDRKRQLYLAGSGKTGSS